MDNNVLNELMAAIAETGMPREQILARIKQMQGTAAIVPQLEGVLETGEYQGKTALYAGTVYMDADGSLVEANDNWTVQLTVAPGHEYQLNNSTGMLQALDVSQSARRHSDWIVGGFAAVIKYTVGNSTDTETLWGVIGNEETNGTFSVTKITGTNTAGAFGLFTTYVQDALKHAWSWHHQTDYVLDVNEIKAIRTARVRRSAQAQKVPMIGSLSEDAMAQRRGRQTRQEPAAVRNYNASDVYDPGLRA